MPSRERTSLLSAAGRFKPASPRGLETAVGKQKTPTLQEGAAGDWRAPTPDSETRFPASWSQTTLPPTPAERQVGLPAASMWVQDQVSVGELSALCTPGTICRPSSRSCSGLISD